MCNFELCKSKKTKQRAKNGSNTSPSQSVFLCVDVQLYNKGRLRSHYGYELNVCWLKQILP